MAYYSAFDVCAQIREDWVEGRMDAKGKKCPGGYWIAASKQCAKKGGGKGRKAALVAGLAAGAVGAGAYAASRMKKRSSSGPGSSSGEVTQEAPSPMQEAPSPMKPQNKAARLADRAKAEATGMVRKTRAYTRRASTAMGASVRTGAERASNLAQSGANRAKRAAQAGADRAARIARRRRQQETAEDQA